ncbi:MAG: helicase HerA-like domain-containing protein [Acidimicrobiales bacterium]
MAEGAEGARETEERAGTDFATRVAEGYAADGKTVELGRGMLDGTVQSEAVVQVPASMFNRHGLIAGATGTGKTKTLQLVAEQLSAIGVPVFAADMKGDLAGLAQPAVSDEKIDARIKELGVGVFFVTQLPDDVPDDVLAQLGNRIQHALRAHTPRDAKALKTAVTTYPRTDDYDLEEAITSLGIGEAVVTILSEKGAPTPVVWTKLRAPQSLMDTIGVEEMEAGAKADPIWERYAEPVDRESAREMLEKRLDDLAARDAADAKAGEPADTERERTRDRAPERGDRTERRRSDDDNVIERYLKSREGRAMVNRVVRGLFGLLRRGR